MKNYLIVGLGNPGEKFENTRHNIGFALLDRLAAEKEVSFSNEKKHQSLVASFSEGDAKIILVKPQTFMNKSGLAIQSVIKYYDIEKNNLLVVHDDADLFFGKMKLSESSGAAGHRGVLSAIKNLGDQNFSRLRIGIRPEENFFSKLIRPKASSLVLKKFSKKEFAELDTLFDQSRKIVEEFIAQ